MSRIVKKYFAKAVTDLNALNRYLENMADQGLMLEGIDLPYLLFENGSSKKVRFNAVVVSDLAEEDVDGYVSLCRETGWELICRYSELLVFSTEDMDIPDIDSEEKMPVKIENPNKKKLGWKRFLFLGIASVATISIIMIIAALIGFACSGKSSNNAEDANYWWEIYPGDYCVPNYGFELMPVRSGRAVINVYKFSRYSTLLDDSIELFIDCTYSEEDYAREVERLKYLVCLRRTADSPNDEEERGDGTIELDEGFLAPAIVEVLLRGEGAEYALLYENEHRILYVYLQWWPQKRLDIDSAYLPVENVDYEYAP